MTTNTFHALKQEIPCHKKMWSAYLHIYCCRWCCEGWAYICGIERKSPMRGWQKLCNLAFSRQTHFYLSIQCDKFKWMMLNIGNSNISLHQIPWEIFIISLLFPFCLFLAKHCKKKKESSPGCEQMFLDFFFVYTYIPLDQRSIKTII